MQVQKLKEQLVITFAFSPYLLSTIHTLEGRKFDGKKKQWTVPTAHVVPTVQRLGPYGFSFSPEVLRLYKHEYLKLKKIDRMKVGDFRPSELALIEATGIPFYLYQKMGAGFQVVSESSLLGDQPGLGKTLQSIGSTRLVDAKKVLIFCPVSVKMTWQEEIEKWAPGATSIVVGGTPKQRTEQWGTDVNYYICNYHLLLRDLKTMQAVDWDFIIADEATSISNPKSKTAKLLKKIKAKRKLALTGTPLSNSVEDVWSIMDWVRPGLLGTYWEFVEEYCNRDKYGAITGYKNLTKLRQKVGQFMLRRLKKDVLTELPPKTFENIYVEFSPEEQSLYDSIKEGLTEELEKAGMFDSENLSSALVKLVRLTQMADSAELINGERMSSKLDSLKELLKVVLSNDEKAIVFTQFKEMADILMRELAEYKPLMIAGPVSQEERDRNRHMFNQDDEHRVLIMTAAGSMGLNLQRATAVVHYDIPWSISQAEQREDRAHRNGQKENVTVFRMMVRNTVDEYKLKVLHKKQATADIVLGDSEADEARKIGLSKADLRNILK